MFVFWVFIIIVILLGLYYLKIKIEEGITLREIKNMEIDGKQPWSKTIMVIEKVIEYTGKMINIILFPLFAIFTYPELLPYEQQKEIDRWLDVRRVVGGIIIYVMAIANLPFIALLAALGFPVSYLLIHVALSIALICRWNWARILFGVGAVGVGILFLMLTIQYMVMPRDTSASIFPYDLIIGTVAFVGGILLLYSKSVKYYIYYKRGA